MIDNAMLQTIYDCLQTSLLQGEMMTHLITSLHMEGMQICKERENTKIELRKERKKWNPFEISR